MDSVLNKFLKFLTLLGMLWNKWIQFTPLWSKQEINFNRRKKTIIRAITHKMKSKNYLIKMKKNISKINLRLKTGKKYLCFGIWTFNLKLANKTFQELIKGRLKIFISLKKILWWYWASDRMGSWKWLTSKKISLWNRLKYQIFAFLVCKL